LNIQVMSNMTVEPDVPASFSPRQVPQKVKNAVFHLTKSIKKIHLIDVESSSPVGLTCKAIRRGSEMVLDIAATVASEGVGNVKATHGLDIVSAIISACFSLRAVVKRVRKTVRTIFDLRLINEEIAAKKTHLLRVGARLKRQRGKAHSEANKLRVSLKNRLSRLNHQKRKCIEQLQCSHKIPAKVIEIAAACLSGAYVIGTLTNKISQRTSTALCSAGAVLGTAVGSIGILIGGFEISRGIQKALRARRQLHNIQNSKMPDHSSSGIENNMWDICKRLHSTSTARAELKARKEYTRSILRACNGSLATVGGALAIAGAFTMGWSAIGIGIAAVAVALVSIGLSIGSHIRGRKLKLQMKDQSISKTEVEGLSKFLEKCSTDQRTEVAHILGIEVYQDLKDAPEEVLMHQYAKVVKDEEKGEEK